MRITTLAPLVGLVLALALVLAGRASASHPLTLAEALERPVEVDVR